MSKAGQGPRASQREPPCACLAARFFRGACPAWHQAAAGTSLAVGSGVTEAAGTHMVPATVPGCWFWSDMTWRLGGKGGACRCPAVSLHAHSEYGMVAGMQGTWRHGLACGWGPDLEHRPQRHAQRGMLVAARGTWGAGGGSHATPEGAPSFIASPRSARGCHVPCRVSETAEAMRAAAPRGGSAISNSREFMAEPRPDRALFDIHHAPRWPSAGPPGPRCPLQRGGRGGRRGRRGAPLLHRLGPALPCGPGRCAGGAVGRSLPGW